MDNRIGPIQEKWLQSLEQHPERQGKSMLGRKGEYGIYKACCLGELGLIAGVCEWDVDGELRTISKSTAQHYLEDVYESVGIFSYRGDSIADQTEHSLAYFNDSNKTWPEIAAMIRANPERWLKEPK